MAQTFDLSKLSFLVVDSNSHTASITTGILKSIGARSAISADDTRVAFEQLEHSQIDVVIMDMDFSDCLDGLEFTRFVRSGDGKADVRVPIIMICARPEKSRVLAARDAGVHEFLRRPFSAGELRQRIESAVGHPRRFVQKSSYVGPDRRRTGDRNYAGTEHRHLAAQKAAEKNPKVETT